MVGSIKYLKISIMNQDKCVCCMFCNKIQTHTFSSDSTVHRLVSSRSKQFSDTTSNIKSVEVSVTTGKPSNKTKLLPERNAP